MKVAVLMAVHNDQLYIEDALKSLLKQRHAAELDIIVVNDGSTDETGAILRRMEKSHPEIRLFETENTGVTRARNETLEQLRPDTDFVTFLDGDDLSAEGRFERDLAIFRSKPQLDLIYSRLCHFEESDPESLAPNRDSRTYQGRFIQLSSGLYSHALIKRVGRFDEELKQAEDTDFILRMFETCPNYLLSDEVAFYYRRHANNMTLDRKLASREFARAMLKSAKRRRQLPDYRMPAGLFEAERGREAPDWI